MKPLIILATAAAVATPLAIAAPADAQYRTNQQRELRECNRELRTVNTRNQYRRELQECRRELRQARRHDNRNWRRWAAYDYNRTDPAYGNYYADRYYRNGSYYADRRLGWSDRVYRGGNGQYYCRRSDGTTGLIIGAGVGALIGNQVHIGGSSTLRTIAGGAVGAAIGSAIDRGQVRCN